MQEPGQLEADSLAVALTKPAMKLGVPLLALYLSVMGTFFAWMFYQAATRNTSMLGIVGFIAIWSVIYASLFLITSKDPFGLNILWLNLTEFRQPRTHAFWGNTDAYMP